MKLSAILLCSLALTAARPSLASAPFQPVDDTVGGRRVTWLKNLGALALYGAPRDEAIARVLADRELVATKITHARGVTMVEIRTPSGAWTVGRQAELALSLRRLEAVTGTGSVFFAGAAAVVQTGRIWVYLPPHTGAARAARSLSALGLSLERYYEATRGIAIGRPGPGYDVGERLAALRRSGREVTAETMQRYVPAAPTDPYFGRQWYLENTGDNALGYYTGVPIEALPHADLRVLEAWDLESGTAQTSIAVIDTGVDCAHPELRLKCHDGYDAIDDHPDGSPGTNLDAPHGTAVAGLAVSPADGAGMVGVCPECALIPVRLVEYGQFITAEMMLRAFLHAVDAGASVINCSWGPTATGDYVVPPEPGELEGIQYARDARDGLGVPIVYSVGNENSDTQWIGHLMTGEPNTISVGASDQLDLRVGYSNFGDNLDVVAPSSQDFYSPEVLSAALPGAGNLDGDYLTLFGGTSASAPQLSGVLGLVLSADPTLSAAAAKALLIETADKIDPDLGFYDEAGHSPKYGFGRVNARRAVLRALKLEDPLCASPAAQDDCGTHLDENCDGRVDEGCAALTAVGEPCATPTECGDESYWLCPADGRIRSVCTMSCSDRPCPAGSICYKGLCAVDCNDDHPCSAEAGLLCDDDVLGACRTRCAGDSDCTPPDFCDSQLALCTLITDGLPGSPCTSDECLGDGAQCLAEMMGFPGGYCTHKCVTNDKCEDNGKCVTSSRGSFCYKACSLDGDCRPDYLCEQAGPRAGTCYHACNKDSQCRGAEPGWENIVCDLSSGRCVEATDTDSAGNTDSATESGSTDWDTGSAGESANDSDSDADAADSGDTGLDDSGSEPDDTTDEHTGGGAGCACQTATAAARSGLLVRLFVNWGTLFAN